MCVKSLPAEVNPPEVVALLARGGRDRSKNSRTMMRRLNVTEGSISSLHYLRLMLMPLKLFRGFEAVLEEFILVG